MKRDDRRKQSPVSSIIWAIILLALTETEILGVLLVLGIPAGIGWLLFRTLQKRPDSGQEKPLDDCPKPICFHRDKGDHHVLKGNGQDPWDRPNREIDPWDRPDIDIRKYQRR